ncbi:hypothetical protein AB0891_33235 [Streptomyces sp. NPDC007259]|uniref:hypothetical protein n=1 Tax=Streptomyces sp. NPDC007259 TaxID=3154319 RepID=UPI0034559C71
MSLFHATADAYSRHRPGLPDEVVHLLAGTLRGIHCPALLDLGTGTGQVPAALLPVLPQLARLDLVDADRDMLHQADLALRPLADGWHRAEPPGFGYVGQTWSNPRATFPPATVEFGLDVCARDLPQVLSFACPRGVYSAFKQIELLRRQLCTDRVLYEARDAADPNRQVRLFVSTPETPPNTCTRRTNSASSSRRRIPGWTSLHPAARAGSGRRLHPGGLIPAPGWTGRHRARA